MKSEAPPAASKHETGLGVQGLQHHRALQAPGTSAVVELEEDQSLLAGVSQG